ncbi:hypothetical protein CBR_g30959 [Chara braunii]|uniref:Glycosyltransferase 61 catalytic domain-containing protein n=1 Tax=Chara braunii TaxID=69332 RepID=A0A388LDZ8_CHABU|nr:hypothetical protein CBR_g30959 [Chara braunii]|eukprot:GBG80497.1 hypothetical protein CBR_g30959 [Chara braunii]
MWTYNPAMVMVTKSNDVMGSVVKQSRWLLLALAIICLLFSSMHMTLATSVENGDGDGNEDVASLRSASAAYNMGWSANLIDGKGEEDHHRFETTENEAPAVSTINQEGERTGDVGEETPLRKLMQATKTMGASNKKPVSWSTIPAFGQRKLVKNYGGLQDYLEEENEQGIVRREEIEDASREGGGGGRGAEEDGNGKPAGLLKVEVGYMQLFGEERTWQNVRNVYWKDMSGKALEQLVSVCASCSDLTLFRRAVQDDVFCSSQKQPNISPRCGTKMTSQKECEKLRQDLLADLNRTGGGGWFSHPVIHQLPVRPAPYVAKFRNAYVSRNGLIYNDDMVFNPRGNCPRGFDSVIRPNLARTRHHFKKVYVADHVFPGIHHELAETAAQLMGYYRELMEDESIVIHTTGVPTPPPGVKYEEGGWWPRKSAIDLIDYLGFNGSRVVAGDVYAEEVIITQMYCWYMDGTFYYYGTRLRRLMRAVAASTLSKGRPAVEEKKNILRILNTPSFKQETSPLPMVLEERVRMAMAPWQLMAMDTVKGVDKGAEVVQDFSPLPGQGTILVIKRTGRRRIENHDELVAALRKAVEEAARAAAAVEEEEEAPDVERRGEFSAASSHNRRRVVEVYDDSLVRDTGEIWRLFMRADIVIAPHGAGLTNVLASRKGTAVYEFMVPYGLTWDLTRLCWCYRDMSSMLGLYYYSDFPSKLSDERVVYDDEKRSWVRRLLSMTIDVPKTIENVKLIFEERGWELG